MAESITADMQKVIDLYLTEKSFTNATVQKPTNYMLKQISSRFDIDSKNPIMFVFKTANGLLNLCILEESMVDLDTSVLSGVPAEAAKIVNSFADDPVNDVTLFVDPSTKYSVELRGHSLVPTTKTSLGLKALIENAKKINGVKYVDAFDLFDSELGEDAVTLICTIVDLTPNSSPNELFYKIYTPAGENQVSVQYQLPAALYENDEQHEEILSNLKRDIERL